MTKLYKITAPDGTPIHGGSGQWSLPTKRKPGKWMPKVPVHICRTGYHLLRPHGIVEWLPRAPHAAMLWLAEGRGEKQTEGTKSAFAQARLLKPVGLLDETSMRLAAADMAERVLPIFLKVRPRDKRPARAIKAARDFALGKIDAAARDAASDAAWAAARAAASDAAWAAARAAASAAAWDAAWAAARAAARDAARAAAEDANAKIIIAAARKRLREVK